MDTVPAIPAWLMRPLPVNAAVDAALHARLDQLAEKLPGHIRNLDYTLQSVQAYREYDAAVNHAAILIWRALERFYMPDADRSGLLTFALHHLPERAVARILRRLAKDADSQVRRRVRKAIARQSIREVALPLTPDGDWGPAGWTRGNNVGPLSRHRQGRRIQERLGLPPLTNLGDLRALLGIQSPAQLGWFLLATDVDGGPYTKFTVPKSDGTPRDICAPKPQLRWVQRQILDKLLAKAPAHDAAHGFVPGRSTVTNATPHRGAALLLKFDLTDFFPTIHYYRVVGLFASLGYYVGDGRFGTADESSRVAPTLARLCCWTPDPGAWRGAVLPQGAPTSPAISNLVCRRLDARLTGLAMRNGAAYTRYADDLTFSFPKPPVNVGRFRWWVDQICHQEGFFVNQRKFRVIRASQRQLVTGLVVNEELRVPRDERRRFRAVLHACRTKGVASQANGNARFAEYLRGFASYVHMVHPDEGDRLLKEVADLVGPAGGDPGDVP